MNVVVPGDATLRSRVLRVLTRLGKGMDMPAEMLSDSIYFKCVNQPLQLLS